MVKLVAKLPDEEGNGLMAVAEQMVRAKSGTMFVAIALVDCKDVNLNKDTGEMEPRGRIRRIEVVTGFDDVKEAERLLRRATDKRQGRGVAPLDLEVALDQVFIDFPDDAGPGDTPADGGGGGGGGDP
jgi:hypothetical protein